MQEFLAVIVLVALVVVVLLLLVRRKYGFGAGKTISHDNMTLRSKRLGLIGRPDRIVERGGQFIVEDKKPGSRLFDSHRAQMGVYMLLVEEHFGVRPSHAVVVLGNGTRAKVNNTEKLRENVLRVVSRIREAKANLNQPLKARGSVAKCRACGQRKNCRQRVG